MSQSHDLPPAFRGAGKKPGLEVFRVENFDVKPWHQPGSFFEGDCYILLSTQKVKSGNKLIHNIHFWIGDECTQDEKGTAAIYAVQLDDMFNGAAVIFRETQNCEGKEFQSLFRETGGIEYLKGGVKSGFKSAKRHKLANRLCKVKGRRATRLQEVDSKVESLDSSDTFVLDTDEAIYVWRGKYSNVYESYKGTAVANIMNGKRHGGAATIKQCNEGSASEEESEFFQALGYKESLLDAYPSIACSGAEKNNEGNTEIKKQLFKIHKEPGRAAAGPELVCPTGDEPTLKRSMLDKDDSFVLFTEEAVYAWSGTFDTDEETKLSFEQAEKLLKEHNLKLPIVKLRQNMETAQFMQHFPDWYTTSGKTYSLASSLAKSNPHGPTVCKVREPDEMTIKKARGGQFSIFKVLSDEEVDSGEYGDAEIESAIFALTVDDKGGFGDLYSENCYVMYYEDPRNSAVLYWLGKDASDILIGRAAFCAVQMDDKYDGKPLQSRQVQGKESDDLLQFFREESDSTTRLIIHKGKDPRTPNSSSSYEPKQQEMLQVQGYNRRDTRAVEVEYGMGSLNSNDCFIVKNGRTKSLWFGKFATGDERELCKEIFTHLFPKEEPIIVPEGSDEEFKNSSFSKVEAYNQCRKAEIFNAVEAPKLFQLSNASGRFVRTEIPAFVQEDLVTEDVMILVTEKDAFLWYGAESRKDEREKALAVVLEYMESRSIDLPVAFLKQGNESNYFKNQFPSWNDNMWEGLVATFRDMGISPSQKGQASQMSVQQARQYMTNSVFKPYSYDVLTSDEPPADVDLKFKEKHLSHAEFLSIFGMGPADFQGLPVWKQSNLKKEVGLF